MNNENIFRPINNFSIVNYDFVNFTNQCCLC